MPEGQSQVSAKQTATVKDVVCWLCLVITTSRSIGLAVTFNPRAVFLRIQAPLLGASAYAGGDSVGGHYCRGGEHFDKPFPGILAIALLCAVPPGIDGYHTFFTHPFAGNDLQT